MRISEKKKEKISEQILYYLYSSSPKALFTSQIAEELARDDEFIKTLLTELKKKKFVKEIKKNPQGTEYIRRVRWKLRDEVYQYFLNKK